jgi:starch synthase (maltosyl-transferring)
MKMENGRRRVVIRRVKPEIDGGRHPVKRVVGERVVVTADVFADGHDVIAGALLYAKEGRKKWHRVPLELAGNDRYSAGFSVTEVAAYRATLEGWVDRFRTWRRDLEKRLAAGQDVSADLQAGAGLVREAADRATGRDRAPLRETAETLAGDGDIPERIAAALHEDLLARMDAWPDLEQATRYAPELRVVVERERAGFSAWYEVFPRSTSPEPGRHGTLRDLEAHLPHVADLGFDVVYLPPIHPIGLTHRKGRNNSPVAEPGDVGSPWAIGSEEGGHKAVHPDLGTLDDFRRVVEKARDVGMEIDLDIAFQCSPDHPYAKEHPEWFRKRPDGSIQYAENPPKKYEDIYPFDFECDAWRSLWKELCSVVRFWADQGVRAFRVDNPHTKSFRFWEWLIANVRKAHPDAIFLAEAFTRPKVMYELAKIGFTQSYTYFTWRNTSWEFREYLTELTRPPVADFFRPNFWPNTPDILPEHLQKGNRATFVSRLVLAATLSSNYGIYGPAFELMERTPREPGGEEYLDSEKYELKHRDLDRAPNLHDVVARVNRIRRENPALRQTRRIRFHDSTNDKLLCYSKSSDDGSSVILVVVNLETRYRHTGWLELDLEALAVGPDEPFMVHDLLDDTRYVWRGPRSFVELDPATSAAHIFRVTGKVRREQDFENYR